MALFPNLMPHKSWIIWQKKSTHIYSWSLKNIIRYLFPPSRGEHCNAILLIPRSKPPNLCPCQHLFGQKKEIENISQEQLEVRVICPSIIPYSSSVVTVLKKGGTWHMCLDFMALNKLIIKDKFPVPIINIPLYELHGANFFIKVEQHSRYREIKIKWVGILKDNF